MAEAMVGNAGRLMPVGGLFGRSWRAYKSRAKSMTLVILLGVLMMVAVGALFAVAAAVMGSSQIAGLVASVILVLAIMVLSLWMQAALIFAASSRGLGTMASFSMAWKRLWAYIWLVLAFTFVCYGGFALLIVPGIILTVLTGMSLFVFANEDRGGLDAMVASWEYVRGRWWGVLGRFLLLMLLYVLAVGGPMQGVAYLAQASAYAGEAGNAYALLFVFGALMLFALFVAAPFINVFMNELYEDLKATRLPAPEGFQKRARRKALLAGWVGNIILVLLMAAAFGIPYMSRMNENRVSELMNSIYTGDIAAVEAFISGNPEAVRTGGYKGLEGLPFLSAGLNSKNPEMVRLLLEAGADPNMQDQEMRSPLDIALFEWRWDGRPETLEIIRLLVKNGAEPNSMDSDGFTLLDHFAAMGDLEMVNVLLDKGVDVNTVNSHGGIALYQAILAGQAEAVNLLVAKGADVNFSAQETTPLALAMEKGDRAIIDALKAAGARQ